MGFPTINEYLDALRFDGAMSKYSRLRLEKDEFGDAVYSSGNFAVVVKMQDADSGKYYAVKCFTKDVSHRMESYAKISRELSSVDSNYIVAYEYLESEIYINDDEDEFPAVVMEWVESETLGVYLRRLCDAGDKWMIRRLADRFDAMALWLMGQRFAHGDLKSDNILVDAHGNLRLIDYDGMFTPDMLGERSRENGSPGFRHPNRQPTHFGKHIDNVSILIISLCLHALAVDNSLAADNDFGDKLLFSESDLKDANRVWATLARLNNDKHISLRLNTLLVAINNGVDLNLSNIPYILNHDLGIELQAIVNAVKLPITPQPAPAAAKPQFANQTFTVNGVSFTMIAVDGGTFQMGDTFGGGDSDEKPVHSVTLSSYYIGETEVTQALWEAVMGSNPSDFKGSNKPVEYISWNDCQEFVTKLSQATGKTFRLPTEAEWEYAARGGNRSKGYKYSGSNDLGAVAWYYGNSGRTTHEVKTKAANELGIYDMSGNVWEWCSDWYGSYSSNAQTNPTGPTSGSSRVLRGGSWTTTGRAAACLFATTTSPAAGTTTAGCGWL